MSAAARRLSQAIQQAQSGDLDGALRTASKVIRYNPNYPEGRLVMGMLCRDSGRLPEALEHLELAVRCRPRDPAFLDALGTAYHAIGRHGEAQKVLVQALTLNPGDPKVVYNLGCASLELGDHETARTCFLRLVQDQTRDPEAWLNLGVTEGRLGNPKEAIVALRKSLEIDPNNATAWMNLAGLLAHLGQPDTPLTCYRRACELSPESPVCHARMGWYLVGQGELSQGRAAFEQALLLDPNQASATAGMAHLLTIDGCITDARELLEPHVEESGDVRVATTWSTICLRHGQPEDALSIVESLAGESLPALDMAQLHFSLGNLRNALGEHEEAFSCWLRANVQLGLHWDPEGARAEVTAIQEAWSDSAQLAQASARVPRMIFVLGMPRSGTTLVEQILSCHPQVRAMGEREELRQMALGAGDHWPSIMASLSAEALDEKASQYLKSVGAGAGDALWVTDKMPINFRYIGWIRQLFPQARIVHLQRHPLDVGLSCLRQHFVGDGNAWSTSLEGIAGLMEDHARLMKHWRAQRTDDLMEL